MPTRQYSAVRRPDSTVLVTWSGLQNGDDGAPYEAPPMADRALQVSGVFGAGGTLVLEGTIDGVNWATLNDPQGNALTITSSKIEQIMELVVSVRPRVSAGDGDTSLVVSMLLKETH